MKKVPQFTPTGCLLNAYRRDREKGYNARSAGYRTTREVQEFVGEPIDKVRRELAKLDKADIVFGYKDPQMGDGRSIFWQIMKPLKKGSVVKVIRPISARDEIVEATVEGIFPESVLPIQVRFEDGETTGYLHQEIRDIVS